MMRGIYKFPLRLRSLFRKRRVEQELSDELRFHLEELMEEKVIRGMTSAEARYAALRELGGVEQIKEECRDMRRVNYIENFLQDVRYGLRQLRRSPGFTAVAVLTLALGIAPNTAIFTVVNSVLLQPLPYPHPEQLFLIQSGTPDRGFGPLTDVEYAEYEKQSRAFGHLAAFSAGIANLTGAGEPVVVHGEFLADPGHRSCARTGLSP
jgi:hypothetical protein